MTALILLVWVGLTVVSAGMSPLKGVFSPTAGLHPLRWLVLAGVLWLLAGQGQKQA
jgi:hypothetical protein